MRLARYTSHLVRLSLQRFCWGAIDAVMFGSRTESCQLPQTIIANKRRILCYAPPMDEGRKRVLLIAASILAARKLAQYDSGARVPATITAIAVQFGGLSRSWMRLIAVTR